MKQPALTKAIDEIRNAEIAAAQLRALFTTISEGHWSSLPEFEDVVLLAQLGINCAEALCGNLGSVESDLNRITRSR